MYKLNVILSKDSIVRVGDFIICKSAYDYIITSGSLQKAYENCKDGEWLLYLLRRLNLSRIEIIQSCEHRALIETHNIITSTKYSNTKPFNLLRIRKENLANFIRYVYEWNDIESKLIEHNILIKDE